MGEPFFEVSAFLGCFMACRQSGEGGESEADPSELGQGQEEDRGRRTKGDGGEKGHNLAVDRLEI